MLTVRAQCHMSEDNCGARFDGICPDVLEEELCRCNVHLFHARCGVRRRVRSRGGTLLKGQKKPPPRSAKGTTLDVVHKWL